MSRTSAHALTRLLTTADRARPYPPARRSPTVASLRFALPRPTLADVHVLDVTGQRVRTLAAGELAAGEHDCAWDGRDDRGARCAAGTYVLRLETNGSLLTSRIVALG